MIAAEIDGFANVRFHGCQFESEGLGILAVGDSGVTARGCDFSVGDQPVYFESKGDLVLEKNTWSGSGSGSEKIEKVFLAPTGWLISRIVERYFGR